MPLQFEARPCCMLVPGASGSGKTTFVLKYLCADHSLHTRFIFDPEGEYARRLNLAAATCEEELICAAEEGFCIYDPTVAYPGRNEEALQFFCDWSLQCAESMPGRKVLVVDEAWKYCSPNKLPLALANCIQTGRKRGLAMMFVSQRPHLLNGSITNEVTELICFRLQELPALDRVEFLGADRNEIASMRDGDYVAINCKERGILRGNIFKKNGKRARN